MKVGDFCDIIMGQAPAGENYNDLGVGYPLLAGAGDLGDSFPQAKRFSKTATKLNQVGDIILCVRATIGNKNWADKIYCLGRGVAAIRVKNDKKTDIKYFWHWLTANTENLLKKAKGATFKQVTKQDINDLPCELPPLSEQKRIVAILDKVDDIIRKRKQSIKLLDELVKAKFVKMFGDPLSSSNNKWPIYKIGDKLSVTSGGTPPTNNPLFWENGDIPWIGSNMCQNNMIYTNDGKFITQEGLEKSSTKIIKKGNVLVALVGATIGKVGLLKFDTAINQNIAAINVNTSNEFSPEYIYYLIQFLYKKFMEIGSGKFKMANQSFIRNLMLPTPPLFLQKEFSNCVRKNEVLKLNIKKYLEDIHVLKFSLVQALFKK